MNILTLDARLWSAAKQAGLTRGEVQNIIADALSEAAQLLPSQFEFLNIIIGPTLSEWVIPETGGMGMTYSDEYISITFDAGVPYGAERMKETLRATVFHEMVHAVTFAHDPWQASALFGTVTEGLATVFERDYANSSPLWARYEGDVVMQKWYDEMKSLPQSEEKNRSYFFEHEDGRKWIVYKTGTWIIDKLLASGEDMFDLMKLDHRTVLDKFEALQRV